LSLPAQALVLVSAQSNSGAGDGANVGSLGSAYIANGAAVPGFNFTSGSALSSIGGTPLSGWADTKATDGSVLVTARAEADLAFGRLRAYSEAGTSSVAGGSFYSTAFSQARWIDTVTFDNTTGNALELDFFWETDGSVTPQRADSIRDITSSITLSRVNSFVGLKAANGQYLNYLGGAQYNYYGVDANGGYFFTFQPAGGNPDGAWRTSFGAGESGLIAATLFIPVGLSSINIDALLEVDCRLGAICDFGHTALFGFGDLPEGMSWTSESGVFLTASDPPPDGVPEPTTLALLALGLVGLGISRSQRKQEFQRGASTRCRD
jgi:hypothetical protein